MNSIEAKCDDNSDGQGGAEPLETLLEVLFDELLLPMAQQMQADGVSPFPREPDDRWPSYYVPRRSQAMLPADFHGAACADAVEFAKRMATHWRELGRANLADAAGRFGATAQVARDANALRAAQAADSGTAELNPFVYVMF